MARFNTDDGALNAASKWGWLVIKHHGKWILTRDGRKIVTSDLTALSREDLEPAREDSK